jgi:hypothetical protein
LQPCSHSKARVQRANFDVQLHIRESMSPLVTRPNGFRACAFNASWNDTVTFGKICPRAG